MKVVCVYSLDDFFTVDQPLGYGASLPFGIAMIATVIKRAGHEVRTLVLTPVSDIEALVRSMIADFRPEMFCLTSVSTQFPLIVKVAARVKSIDQRTIVILGGHHASLNPEEAIAEEAIEAICVGEGEGPVLEFIRQIEAGRQPSAVPHFWIKRPGGKEIERNPTGPFATDLDALPFPDRSLWERWMAGPPPRPPVLVGRGCPFRCSYCSNHALRRLAEGTYVRFRSPANVVAEVRALAGQYPRLREIYLEVETIGANPKYAAELCDELARYNAMRETPIAFGINLAVTHRFGQDETFARELLGHFQRANIRTFNIGLESGSERLRKEVLRRPPYTNEDLLRFTGWARDMGFQVVLFVIIGIPRETRAEMEETIRICRACKPTNVLLSIFYPYPGTDLCALAKELRLLPEGAAASRRERCRVHLRGGELSRLRVMMAYITFYYRVFRGRWAAIAVLGMTARQVASMNSGAISLLRGMQTLHRLRRLYTKA